MQGVRAAQGTFGSGGRHPCKFGDVVNAGHETSICPALVGGVRWVLVWLHRVIYAWIWMWQRAFSFDAL